MRRILVMVCFWMLSFVAPMAAQAAEEPVRLHAPEALSATGLLDHILPRFSLKTGVKVELAESPENADLALGPEGRSMFEGAGAVWHLQVLSPDHDGAARLAEWIGGDIGLRTITSFAPEGDALFQPPTQQEVETAEIVPDGDAELGHELSVVMCGRCHAVDEAGRKKTIGSTPSFFVLRAFEDWEYRFSAFYALNPHGAFTQIAEVTPPFPIDRPSPIAPVEMTLEDLEAILAYVATVEAADLGAPLEHQ